MQTKPMLTRADARLLMQAALAEAERLSLEVTVAIVDEAGIPLLVERLDGARLLTPEAAMLKARTAAMTRTAAAALQAQVQINAALLSFPGRMPLAGVAPLVHRGVAVGGVASSGASPEEDGAICKAALDAMMNLPDVPLQT